MQGGHAHWQRAFEIRIWQDMSGNVCSDATVKPPVHLWEAGEVTV